MVAQREIEEQGNAKDDTIIEFTVLYFGQQVGTPKNMKGHPEQWRRRGPSALSKQRDLCEM